MGAKRVGRIGLVRVAAATLVLAAVLVPTHVAGAAQAEPPVMVRAWYWQDQFQQKVTDPTTGADIAVLEAPNPFCPSTPATTPEQSCREGRLPIEVRASDYEAPNKISAVAFDFSLVPLGSEISKFTASFLEASDSQSPSYNHTDKKLQACLIQDFFGDGEARLYSEAPKYACAKSDPVAKRKEVAGAEPGDPSTFVWKFDLTSHAQTWVTKGAPINAIMITPAEPKEPGPPDANWRVVLAGPVEENGVVTSAKFEPPDEPVIPPITGGDPSTGGDFSSGSSGGFTTSGGTTSGLPGPTGGEAPVADDPGAPSPSPAAPPTSPLAAEAPAAGGLPGYVWLAILAGLIFFSLMRSVVIEKATGARPDGVLAQIRTLNAGRRGGEAVEPPAALTGLRPVADAFRSVGRRVASVGGRIRGLGR